MLKKSSVMKNTWGKMDVTIHHCMDDTKGLTAWSGRLKQAQQHFVDIHKLALPWPGARGKKMEMCWLWLYEKFSFVVVILHSMA